MPPDPPLTTERFGVQYVIESRVAMLVGYAFILGATVGVVAFYILLKVTQ